eukprot:gene9726-10717_t
METAYDLHDLIKLERQWNMLRLTLQEKVTSDAKLYLDTSIFQGLKINRIFHHRSEIDENLTNQGNEVKKHLLRLSLINLAFSCFECIAKNLGDAFQVDPEQLPGTISFCKSKLKKFLSADITIGFLLASLISTNKFQNYSASGVFVKCCLLSPDLLWNNKQFEKTVSRMCFENSIMFTDLISAVSKALIRRLRKESKESVVLFLRNHVSTFNIMSTLLRHFLCFLTESSKVNTGSSSSFAMGASKMQLCSKLKSLYKIMKLLKMLQYLTCSQKETLHCSLKENASLVKRDGQSEILIEFNGIVSQLQDFANFSRNLENILIVNSLSNYSCKYALKVVKLTLETFGYKDEMFKYAIRVLEFSLQLNWASFFVQQSHHLIEDASRSFFDESDFESDDGFSSSTMSRFRLWIIVLLKCCGIIAENADDATFDSVMKCLAKLSSCICSAFFRKDRNKHRYMAAAKGWLDILMEEDDQLFEAMQYCLKIYTQKQENRQQLSEIICPHSLFYYLLYEISFDHMVCIDWLISDETCFDHVITLYLDLVTSDFELFIDVMNEIDDDTKQQRAEDLDFSSSSNDEICEPRSDAGSCDSMNAPITSFLVAPRLGKDVAQEQPAEELCTSSSEQALTSGVLFSSQSEILRDPSLDTEMKCIEFSEDAYHRSSSDSNTSIQPSFAAEQVMDVLIRMRLKLERFHEKSLSTKPLDSVIDGLIKVEDLFDSYHAGFCGSMSIVNM